MYFHVGIKRRFKMSLLVSSPEKNVEFLVKEHTIVGKFTPTSANPQFVDFYLAIQSFSKRGHSTPHSTAHALKLLFYNRISKNGEFLILNSKVMEIDNHYSAIQ